MTWPRGNLFIDGTFLLDLRDNSAKDFGSCAPVGVIQTGRRWV